MDKAVLKEKLLQLFILGYTGEKANTQFLKLISQNLGGIIFFAENLKNRSFFKNQILQFKKLTKIPLFFSIDQEGGLVERTIFLDEKVEYLTAKTLSRLSNTEIKKHYDILAKDLIDLGINFNFAPVLDVNSNPFNPVIGTRSFGDNPQTVNNYAKICINTFQKNNIITCGKHFAGHGNTQVDSHLNMPVVDENFDEFYKTHLVTFKNAVENNVDTIMVSHIHFSFFDKEKIPASLSKNAINYLKNDLNFKGLIISDDMVMGGISKNYGLKESIIMALKAGIEVLIFRSASEELLSAIDEISELAIKDKELKNKILYANEKIINFKNKKLHDIIPQTFSCRNAQAEIDKLGTKVLIINDKKNLIKKINLSDLRVITFNYEKIYNLSANVENLAQLLHAKEIRYSLNPDKEETENILKRINPNETVIFLSYNAHINSGQTKLYKQIKQNKIFVSCALDDDIALLPKSETTISLCSYKSPVLRAVADIFIKNKKK